MDNKEEQITIPKSKALAILAQLEEFVKPQLQELQLETIPTKWEQITTIEHACMVVPPSEDKQVLLAYKGTDKDMIAAQAFLKLCIVSRAMNKLNNDGEVWEPDWTDVNEYKYYAFPRYVAGSGFSDFGYGYDDADACVGSRLCFMSRDMVAHAFENFKQLYNDLFTL